jgi:hypothetical protein
MTEKREPNTLDIFFPVIRSGVFEAEESIHKPLTLRWGGHFLPNPLEQLGDRGWRIPSLDA